MILLALLVALAEPAETPRQFIERVYAAYALHEYNPLTRMNGVFAPALIQQIREDERLARGEVGFLDGDPLCDCQDYGELTAHIRKLDQPTKQSASALVHVDLGEGTARDLRLELVLTHSGWRVADVISSDGQSLLHGLQRSNQKR